MASPMAQAMIHMAPVAAATMVMVISVFNGLGRVFWAWVSDMIGRSQVYFLLYAIQVVIFFSLPHLTNVTLFATAFAIIGLCYGGGFGTMPSFTADFFGPKYMGGIRTKRFSRFLKQFGCGDFCGNRPQSPLDKPNRISTCIISFRARVD